MPCILFPRIFLPLKISQSKTTLIPHSFAVIHFNFNLQLQSEGWSRAIDPDRQPALALQWPCADGYVNVEISTHAVEGAQRSEC